MKKEKVNASIDSRSYTTEVEADLNNKAYALFGSGIGKLFLQYLENLTTGNIHGAGVPIESLAHFEGQRWVVALIKHRTELGRRNGDTN
jgi:transcription antitermination factor NusA-like protein|tara:strand:+ start:5254 stop:5520 length:267 start_codon:yes stop_codon:yes gene_type:complete